MLDALNTLDICVTLPERVLGVGLPSRALQRRKIRKAPDARATPSRKSRISFMDSENSRPGPERSGAGGIW